jgi:hypothetical protein
MMAEFTLGLLGLVMGRSCIANYQNRSYRLIDDLKFSDEERKMADNYFTILRNDFTEIWHDQGIELGGGQPFTVGTGR